MSIYTRYEPHRKKKSKAPLFLFLFFLVVTGSAYIYRKEILFLFAKDQKIRAEKMKERCGELWKSGNLKEKEIEEFQNIAQQYSEKEPTSPEAYHLVARSQFWNLHRLGIQFQKESLILHLGSPFSEFLGNSNLVSSTLDQIFWNAKKATSLGNSDFIDAPNNQVLLFLGETFREVRKPQSLISELGNLELEKISPELRPVFLWLLTYNTMLAGDANGLDKIIQMTKNPEQALGFGFSSREEIFLKGLGKFYKNDYVGALALLRQSKSNNPDRITETAIFTEATIFHKQNLTQKGIDLLEEFYTFSGKKNPEALRLIGNFIQERPGTKTKLDLQIQTSE